METFIGATPHRSLFAESAQRPPSPDGGERRVISKPELPPFRCMALFAAFLGNNMAEKAIWLKRENDDTLTVSVEAGGKWVEVIREHGEGPISHIVEPSGIERRIKEAATEASEQDLRASGGIVNAP